MEQWAEIRRLVFVEGRSRRSICTEFGLHWETVKKILEHAEPPGYRRRQPREKPKIGPYLGIIEETLRQDGGIYRKQRHTAIRLFRRLRNEHGYTGGYTAVKDAVRQWRRQRGEVFVPLRHPPAEAQVDFGQAQVILQGRTTAVALFVMTLPFSDAIFCCVFPQECTEAFQEGHRRAFEFFGGVPRRISYDNSKIAVKKVVGPRARELTREFLRLKSHYLFAHHFCRVRRANEKGHVENLLGFGRRNFLVPLPRVDSLEELNGQLEIACREDRQRSVRGKPESKAELLVQEIPHLLRIPTEAFEAWQVRTAQVNSLSLVRFHRNDYSVPTDYAHHAVTVRGGFEQVQILVADQVVAIHVRNWDKHRITFDPVHYLALLERKPGAFDVARPLEHWSLPECFEVLRRRLETQWEAEGTRRFIKVLRLLESVTLTELTDAIEQALALGVDDADAIRLILEHRREQPVALFRLNDRPHLALVQVQSPDLTGYRCLLTGGAA